MINGVADHALFGDAWVDYLVLILWAAGSFALVRWQLAQREA